jgi:hypothetical protein
MLCWTGNPLFALGLLAEILIVTLIVYTPPGNLLFGTWPISAWAWLPAVPVALLMLVADELRKWSARRRVPALRR